VKIRTATERRTRPDRSAHRGRAPRALALGVALASGLRLSGCAGNEVVAGGAAGTPTASAPPTGTAPASAPTPNTSTSAGTGSGADATGSSTPGSLRSDRCRTADLAGSITTGNGGAAGSVEPYLVLTNTGGSACTLQGWPGVSLVGGGNGTQIGAPATLDRSGEHATVTLQPNGSAHAPLRLTQADNYDAAVCDPRPADGFRVYPPGEKDALYVEATGYTGCASTATELLTVQAVQPGAA